MPVYRCNSCGLVAEEIALSAGTKIACKKCGAAVTLFATVFYVEKLVERYLAISRELEVLRSQDNEEEEQGTPLATMESFRRDQINNTTLLATPEQHQPLREWFTTRKVKTCFDYSQVDTTGFFDEAAVIIGERYWLLNKVIEQIRHAYRQDWSWLNIDLRNYASEGKQIIKDSFRQLYSYTLFSRFTYKKQDDVVGLGIQPAKQIRKFFMGGWLEWWAFMRLAEICLERAAQFSAAHSAQLEFQNEESREIDVIFLVKNSLPIIVECKSGEFRQELEKCSKLRQRLGLDKSQFIICNPDLTNEEVTALTTMYDLTFVNLHTFPIHMNLLIR